MSSEITQKIRYFHFRRPLLNIGRRYMEQTCTACGGITVACKQTGPATYDIGITRCRPNEHYSKKFGRKEAFKALADERTLEVNEGSDLYKELRELLTSFAPFKKSLRAVVRYTNVTE